MSRLLGVYPPVGRRPTMAQPGFGGGCERPAFLFLGWPLDGWRIPPSPRGFGANRRRLVGFAVEEIPRVVWRFACVARQSALGIVVPRKGIVVPHQGIVVPRKGIVVPRQRIGVPRSGTRDRGSRIAHRLSQFQKCECRPFRAHAFWTLGFQGAALRFHISARRPCWTLRSKALNASIPMDRGWKQIE